LGIAQGFAAAQFLTHYRFFPKGFGVGLPGVYLVWSEWRVVCSPSIGT
jgi:hypothetical protein